MANDSQFNKFTNIFSCPIIVLYGIKVSVDEINWHKKWYTQMNIQRIGNVHEKENTWKYYNVRCKVWQSSASNLLLLQINSVLSIYNACYHFPEITGRLLGHIALSYAWDFAACEQVTWESWQMISLLLLVNCSINLPTTILPSMIMHNGSIQ